MPLDQDVLPTTSSEGRLSFQCPAEPTHMTYKSIVRGTDMDVDGLDDAVTNKFSNSKRAKRVQKRARKKVGTALLFPAYKKGKRLGGDGGRKQQR